MSEALKEEVRRLQNTFHYTLEANQGVLEDELGIFNFYIPNGPFTTNQGSQLAIFTFRGFHITGQTDTTRLPATTGDTSGFYVIIEGMGIRGCNLSGARSQSLRRTNAFLVLNTYGDGGIAKSLTYNKNSGSNPEVKCMCSAPNGNSVRVEVLDIDTGNRITDVAGLEAILEFSIELIPEDISSGR